MPQIRTIRPQRLPTTTLPILAIDGPAARRSLGTTAWPSGRFALVELPGQLAIGTLAPLLRKLRGRTVVVWPAPTPAGAKRARLRAEMLADAGAAAVGIVSPHDDTDAETLIEEAARDAHARALPLQGERPARAVLASTGAVDPLGTLTAMTTLLRAHLDAPDDTIDLIAFWCLHVWCLRTRERPFAISPRLVLQGENASADHVCALRLISWLTPAPLIVSRTIAAHVLPALASEQPTLLLDDIAGGMLYRRDMRTLIAAGALREGAFLGPRTRRNPTGLSPCFAPTAIATTATLPDDVRLRALVLTMKAPRREPSHEATIGEPPAAILSLRAALQATAQALAPALANVTTEPPRTVHPAARAKLAPIIALSTAIGSYTGAITTHAVEAAVASEATTAISLLEDLHALYRDTAEHIPTVRMIEDLAATGKPDRVFEPAELAQRLSAFDLKPALVRMHDVVLRGYRAGDLAATFARYLTPLTPVTSNGSVTAA